MCIFVDGGAGGRLLHDLPVSRQANVYHCVHVGLRQPQYPTGSRVSIPTADKLIH